MALGNVFDEDIQGSDNIIFVDKDVDVKLYSDNTTIYSLHSDRFCTANELREIILGSNEKLNSCNYI